MHMCWTHKEFRACKQTKTLICRTLTLIDDTRRLLMYTRAYVYRGMYKLMTSKRQGQFSLFRQTFNYYSKSSSIGVYDCLHCKACNGRCQLTNLARLLVRYCNDGLEQKISWNVKQNSCKCELLYRNKSFLCISIKK